MLRDLGGLSAKIFLLSTLISIAIKGLGPQLPLPPTAPLAGLIVVALPLGMALGLWWSGRQAKP
jgi:hypothetical protein